MQKRKSTLKADSCRNRARNHDSAHAAARFETKCRDRGYRRLAREEREYLKRLISLLDYLSSEVPYFTRRERQWLNGMLGKARGLVGESLKSVESRLQRRRSQTAGA